MKGVTTETGTGQWETAFSMVCAYLGLDYRVYTVKVSYEQKPFCHEVMLHQSIVGLETKTVPEKYCIKPDVITSEV